MGGCFSSRLETAHDQNPNEQTNFQQDMNFSFNSLKTATNNFCTRVREDVFSSSYKGTLQNGCQVTVMVLCANNIFVDFTLIIKIMSGVMHRNVVRLIGYCLEDDHRMLVHEFVGDYSLDQLLFRNSEARDFDLNWGRRVSICRKIACALSYLHDGISPRVIHRGVTPSNILMDSSFNPKLMGFNIARLLEDDESHAKDDTSLIRGTYGYVAPEYAMTGRNSEKTDVYCFGLTLLEIISGRSIYGRINLVAWAWELRRSGRIPEIVDSTILEFPDAEVIRFVNTALFCVQEPSEHRPSMLEVTLMLSDSDVFRNWELCREPRPSWPYCTSNSDDD